MRTRRVTGRSRLHDVRGVTLVELLVVVAVIGILASLALPALQRARGAARRVECAGHLRQIGLALQGYQASFACYPLIAGSPGRSAQGPRVAVQQQYSIFTQFLGFLDHQHTFNATNFEVKLNDWFLFPDASITAGANATVLRTSLAVLLCPEDSARIANDGIAGTSLRANAGSERWFSVGDEPLAGPFDAYRSTGDRDVRDGLSNTVAFGEKLRGVSGSSRIDPRRDCIFSTRMGLPYSPDESLAVCANTSGAPAGHVGTAGWSWVVGSFSHTQYNHISEPNSIYMDCAGRADPLIGIFAARSNHPGGVNGLFLDGSLRFIRSGMDRRVWRSLGTRAGGEAVPAF